MARVEKTALNRGLLFWLANTTKRRASTLLTRRSLYGGVAAKRVGAL